MFGFIELHVDAKDLREIRLRENLIPCGIHDFPLGDQIHVLRGTINNLIRSRFAIQRQQTLTDLIPLKGQEYSYQVSFQSQRVP